MSEFLRKLGKYSTFLLLGISGVLLLFIGFASQVSGIGGSIVPIILATFFVTSTSLGTITFLLWMACLGIQKANKPESSEDTRKESNNVFDPSICLLFLAHYAIFVQVSITESLPVWFVASLIFSGVLLGFLWGRLDRKTLTELTDHRLGKSLIVSLGFLLIFNPIFHDIPLFTGLFLIVLLFCFSLTTAFVGRVSLSNKSANEPWFHEILNFPHRLIVMGLCPIILINPILNLLPEPFPELIFVPMAILYLPLGVLGFLIDLYRPQHSTER